MSELPKLSDCLRTVRQRHGWTLQNISARTGIALSTLSKVENDRMSLTYDKILQLCEGLGISVSELLSGQSHEPADKTRRSVVSSFNSLDLATRNYAYSYLCTDLINKRMVPIIARLNARDIRSFGDLVSHSGEEFAFVLDGEVEVHTRHYAPTRLKAGEGIYIDSTMGHAYLTVGDTDATILCVCSAPTPDLERELIESA